MLAGVAEADTPRAGMFLWLKLLTVPDSGSLRAEFKAEKVVVVPGAPLPRGGMRDASGRASCLRAASTVLEAKRFAAMWVVQGLDGSLQMPVWLLIVC